MTAAHFHLLTHDEYLKKCNTLELLVIVNSSKKTNGVYNEDSCMCIFRKCKTELPKTHYSSHVACSSQK